MTFHPRPAVLARLANRVPLGEGLREQLDKLQPTGIATGIKLTWQGPANAPKAYQASGQLKTIAAGLFKMANDIRLLGSGPRCGIWTRTRSSRR